MSKQQIIDDLLRKTCADIEASASRSIDLISMVGDGADVIMFMAKLAHAMECAALLAVAAMAKDERHADTSIGLVLDHLQENREAKLAVIKAKAADIRAEIEANG